MNSLERKKRAFVLRVRWLLISELYCILQYLLMSTLSPDLKISGLNSDDGKRFQSLHFNTWPRSPQDLVESITHLNVAYTTYSVSH